VIAPRFLPLAREELNETAAYYEASVPGLGKAFLDDVHRAIEVVRENPRIGAPVGKRLLKSILRRFPFSVVYAARDEEIVMLPLPTSAGAQATGGGDNDR
jgi:plasmid stabilization system protein ParE